MIQIELADGRLSAWGKQSDVKRIYWESFPTNLPRGNSPLDLTGSVIKAVFDDGTTANVTIYCTFSPSDGTTVPAGASYIKVTAFYIARNGKTYQAPAQIPVIHPVDLQIVIDENYTPYENYFEQTPGLFNPEKMPLDKSKFKTWILYGKGDDNEPIYAEELLNPTYTHEGILLTSGGGYNSCYYITANPNPKTDVTIYHDINAPSEESFTNAVGIQTSATIDGVSLTAEKAYFEAIPIDYFSLDTPPSEAGPFSFTSDKIVFHFADGTAVKAVHNLTDAFIVFSTQPPAWNTVLSSIDKNFTEGSSGSVWLARRKAPNMVSDFESTKYNYSVSDGVVTWTKEDES